MTRRGFLSAAAAASVYGAVTQPSTLAVEGYIFQQYAESLNKPLKDVIPQVLPMARAAGFDNIELNPSFFVQEAQAQTLSILRAQHFRMPSVYVGGPMHEQEGADQTMAAALHYAMLCVPFGCRAVVNNPDPKPGNAAKTDAELQVQADCLNRIGRTLKSRGFELRVHHHTPQLEHNAREWRHILRNTDPDLVHICVDVDWAYEGGFAPVPFLREVGDRLREIHVRSARNKLWLEDLEDSDIDYRAVAAYLREQKLSPLVVVELAYRPNTKITRSLGEDLRLSRSYAQDVFGFKGDK